MTAAIKPIAEPRDFRVADLALADWGRKEIAIAETEMPGLMAIREEFAPLQPLRGGKVGLGLERERELAARRERRALREQRPHGRELQRAERLLAGHRRDTPGEPVTQNRHGSANVAPGERPMRGPRAIARDRPDPELGSTGGTGRLAPGTRIASLHSQLPC